MGSIMKNKIHIIEVENNEKESLKKILKNINDKKITYIKNKSYKTAEILETIDIVGPAIILNSSGSSGKPKKCIHSLENLNSSAKASGIWLEKQGFKLQNCLIFNTLPLNHISGLMPIFRSKIWSCEHITISSKTSHKCRLEKINLAPCYGSTETAAMVTSLKPKEFLEGIDNVGEILCDINLRISKKGLIQIKSERIGIELLEASKTKNFKDKNGWWESSDLGEIQELNDSSYLKFIRRIDNAFNSGGEIVFPEVIKLRLSKFISNEKIPIENLKISNIPNKEWGNKIEINIYFKKQTSKTDIEYSLKILKNFSKNWPKHERPEAWIIGKNQSNYIKKSNFIFEK
jgi:long-subunit acyl-CoA synthetase (AMP-forming)